MGLLRRRKYLLTALFVLIAVVAVIFGIFQHQVSTARQIDEFAKWVQQHGGKVTREEGPEWIWQRMYPAIDFRPLTEIYVSDKSLSSQCDVLPILSDLQKLSVPKSDFNDDCLSRISELTKLTVFNCDDTRISETAFSSATFPKSLHSLAASQCDLTDETIPRLLECQNLEAIDLPRTKVTDAGLRLLGKITTLKFISLDNLSITGSGLHDLSACKELRDLTLNGTKVTGDDLVELAPFSNLGLLHLNSTSIHSLEHLPVLPLLYNLDLGNTGVGDDDLLILRAKTPKLASLSLDETQITDRGLRLLQDWKTLKGIGIRNTKVSAEAIDEFRRVRPDALLVTEPNKP